MLDSRRESQVRIYKQSKYFVYSTHCTVCLCTNLSHEVVCPWRPHCPQAFPLNTLHSHFLNNLIFVMKKFGNFCAKTRKISIQITRKIQLKLRKCKSIIYRNEKLQNCFGQVEATTVVILRKGGTAFVRKVFDW